MAKNKAKDILKELDLLNNYSNNNNLDTFLNNYSFIYFKNLLIKCIMTLIDYENLPDTMNKRALKEQLLDGWAVLLKDDVLGLINMWVAPNSKMTAYGDFEKVTAYSKYNKYRNIVNTDNSVVLYDNIQKEQPMIMINYYATRLANIDRTIDININAQRTPILLKLKDRDQELTIKNVYRQYQGNAPAITVLKDQGIEESIDVLKTDAPFIAPELHDLRCRILSEALSYFGVRNIPYEKRAQMNETEIDMLGGVTELTREDRLQMQNQCLDQFNRMYGTNIRAIACDDRRAKEIEKIDPEEIVTDFEKKEGEIING